MIGSEVSLLSQAAVAGAFCLSSLTSVLGNPDSVDPVVLFPYFKGNGETGVYLQHSRDGLSFEKINGGRPVFVPPAWPDNQNLTRDPSIVYHNGTFHLVWTSHWTGRVFGYSSSPDLVHWAVPHQVLPFPESLPASGQPMNVWAPELHYDPMREDFFVVFSSTVPARLDEGADEGRDVHGNNHRMYVTRTKDFREFSGADVIYDPGYSSIDGHWVFQPEENRWVVVFKHERMPEHGGKNLRLVFQNPATGAFSGPSERIVGPGSPLNQDWAEGPALLRSPDGWWNLYWDAYGSGFYGLARSKDLVEWQDASDLLRLDEKGHPRHGTPFYAPAEAVGWPEVK
jgi:beta-xylosidase